MKFTRPLLITKLKATGIHLCLSVAVFVYLAYQIYFNWYPQPYFSIDGGWQGIRLVGAVDLVLGPLITFLIFNPHKPRREIVFDLAIIVAIQLGALAYGIHATYSQRPVAVVLIDEFVVSTTMEQYGGMLGSVDELTKYSEEKPPVIFAEIPRTAEGIAEINRFKIEHKVVESAQMRLYRPASELAEALRKLQPVFSRRLERFGARESFDAWLKAKQKSPDEVMIAMFNGRYGLAWLVFDGRGKYLGFFR